MLFRTYGQAVLTLHERTSRLLLAVRPPGKAAAPIAHALTHLLTPMPPHGRQTVTFDNGTEFASHHRLHALGIETFFCDFYAPWQKGGVENAIGRLRRTLPRKTDLATLSDQRFHHLVHAYNHTPRKCLGYATPAEIFIHQVLHLKCESTFPFARARRWGHRTEDRVRAFLPLTPPLSLKGRGGRIGGEGRGRNGALLIAFWCRPTWRRGEGEVSVVLAAR